MQPIFRQELTFMSSSNGPDEIESLEVGLPLLIENESSGVGTYASPILI